MLPDRLRALTVVLLLAPLTAGIAPASAIRDAGQIPTGAGFSVALTLPAAALYPTTARLDASGLPAFARHARRDSQVIVGPYAAIDEAEAVQRRLARSGLRARLLVDESVRHAPGVAGVPAPSAPANVLLVAGGGRLSLVVEMPVEPRHVFTHRAGGVLEVNVGPMGGSVEARQWHAPAGVDLLQRVSMESIDRTIRTRIEVSDAARTSVRTAGSRLYIDIWPVEAELLGRPFPEGFAREAAGRAVAARRPEEPQGPEYNEQIAPAIARLQSMEPFVIAAVASPSPDVLSALEGSLRGLQEWIQRIDAPVESAQAHASLMASVRLVMEAVDPAFTGDRVARAREAFALATAYQLPPTT